MYVYMAVSNGLGWTADPPSAPPYPQSITADHVDEKRVLPKRIKLWRKMGFMTILSGRRQHLPAMAKMTFRKGLWECACFTNDHHQASVHATISSGGWFSSIPLLTCAPLVRADERCSERLSHLPSQLIVPLLSKETNP